MEQCKWHNADIEFVCFQELWRTENTYKFIIGILYTLIADGKEVDTKKMILTK